MESPPSDSVQRLTLRSRALTRPWAVTIDSLIFQAHVDVKGLRKFRGGPLPWPVFMTSAPGLHFRRQLLPKLDGSLVRQNGTPAEREARP